MQFFSYYFAKNNDEMNAISYKFPIIVGKIRKTFELLWPQNIELREDAIRRMRNTLRFYTDLA